MNINLRSKFYSYKYAQLSSMSFLILSLLLTEYSFTGRIILILQSGFSCYIWTYPDNKTMILRNGKMIGTDKVIIDFDYASKMWRSNKIKWGEGQFRYIS